MKLGMRGRETKQGQAEAVAAAAAQMHFTWPSNPCVHCKMQRLNSDAGEVCRALSNIPTVKVDDSYQSGNEERRIVDGKCTLEGQRRQFRRAA